MTLEKYYNKEKTQMGENKIAKKKRNSDKFDLKFKMNNKVKYVYFLLMVLAPHALVNLVHRVQPDILHPSVPKEGMCR